MRVRVREEIWLALASLLMIVALAIWIAGCAGPIAFQNMSPEQIREAVKDREAFIWCGQGTYAGALVQYVIIQADRGQNAKATIGKNCEITFDATGTGYRSTPPPPQHSGDKN